MNQPSKISLFMRIWRVLFFSNCKRQVIALQAKCLYIFFKSMHIKCDKEAFMLGPVGGGLAAGIGAFFYDIFTGYGAECIITFINKFLMAFVCGWLLNLMTRAKELPQLQLILRRIIASVAGCLTYVVLYMTKSYITLYLESNIGEAVDRSATIWATVIGKGYVSLVNGLIAVVVANLIYSSIAAALKKQHLSIS